MSIMNYAGDFPDEMARIANPVNAAITKLTINKLLSSQQEFSLRAM